MEMNSVQKFYAKKTIFITGASGFMGKVLMEKLLYKCDDIKEIIILMRPKRGKTGQQRVEEFEKIPAFWRIMKDKPHVMKKITPVWGDITSVNLGLSDAHFKKVTENTEIVFHMAASLKLEATLKPNILANLTATKHVLDIAEAMKNLIQFMHLSTAFCCPDQEVLDEKVFEFPQKPLDLIGCAEWMSEEAMHAIQKKVLLFQPNTYTYTKRLAEILVRDYYDHLPVCIARPSVVTPAFTDPLPGWVDSLNGPPGIFLAAAKGVLRSMMINADSKMEVIPVDVCINALIYVTKHLATNPRSEETPVYNMTIHESRKITNGKTFEYTRILGKKYPCSAGLWYPDGDITQNVFIHTIKVFLFQWVPAYLIDFILLITGQKRFMVYVQKRISTGMEVLQFFTMRDWNFKSDKVQNLLKTYEGPGEEKMFNFDSENTGDEFEYLKTCLLGARQYCVKDPLSTLPKARIQLRIQYFVHIICKMLFWYFIITTLVKVLGLQEPVNGIFNYFKTTIIGRNTTIEF